MKASKISTIVIVVALCFAAGYGIGRLITSTAEDSEDKKITSIISQMTLEEKCHYVIGTSSRKCESDQELEDILAIKRTVPGVAGTTRPISRLGIPGILLADGPAGLRINPTREGDENTYYCTGFPVGALLASTWDPAAIEKVGEAMGNEVLEYGVDVLLAPGLNIKRNPLCGRNFEYYSEDPLIVGKSAAAMVRGVQSNGVGTSIKHFAANNAEINRLFSDSRVSVKALREIYLKGFEIAVKEAQPWTVMTSYNYLNGPYTSENPELLQTMLRDEWGFKGMVMSDWGGGQHPRLQIAAGNDLIESGKDWQYEDVLAAVKDGSLSEEALDKCVARILELTMKTPRYNGYEYSSKPDLEAHAAVSREIAGQGVVLLKNEGGVLPLEEGAAVKVYGRNNPYKLYAGGTGSGDVHKTHTIYLDEGLEAAGFTLNDDADIAVINLRRQAGEGTDRHVADDFNLTEAEQGWISEAREAGKKVVVVINSGGVIETASWKDKADAIVMAWMPGQEAGHVIADVLSGKVNPSGCLPETFHESYEAVPAQNFPAMELPEGVNNSFYRESEVQLHEVPNVDYQDYIEGVYVGYRYYTTFNVPVSYPFGYGLSYTTFEMSDYKARISGGTVKASVTVKNTGERAGRKVVQIYLSRPEGCGAPVRELKAYAKTAELAPGESCTVELKFPAADLASFDEASSAWVAEAGDYTLSLCEDSATELAAATVKLGKTYVKKVADVLHTEGDLFIGTYDPEKLL